MNLIQLRLRANAVDDSQVNVALQAGASACERFNASYSVRLAQEQGWFLDVYIGSTPFSPDQDLVTSTLLRRGTPFDISFSVIGADGDAVATMYGIREDGDAQVIWCNEAVSLNPGCSTEQLDPDALARLGIDIELRELGGSTFVYSPRAASHLESMNPTMVRRLVHSFQHDPLVRETARFLSWEYEHRKIA